VKVFLHWGIGILSHLCEHGDDLLVIKVGHRVLIRTTLLQQGRFRKLKWLPSSVAFTCARVLASGSLTKVIKQCSLYRLGMTLAWEIGQWEVRDLDTFFFLSVAYVQDNWG